VPSAQQLATAAQRSRKARDYEETARLYRLLLEHHADSPEAANVAVRLGDVLRTTGDHRGALEAYERYLEHGGVLAPEAEYGRISALRALGRASAEASAIEAYLQAHPGDHRQGELETRLAELRARPDR
jgi:predicted TPR repeat methyltransferase